MPSKSRPAGGSAGGGRSFDDTPEAGQLRAPGAVLSRPGVMSVI
ncbi:hypothetical protein [Streptomyces sp. G-G2]|nr:hypothetical protein [Streptomyces sp. G-G2]MDJ0379381.1 hypothetical protein [Streptomyces sp. G-G2]